ncbi:MAG: hypothetical protein WC852_04415 [Candidatus Nanoarchaeia archaeon]|jgi:hypothetical protein
MNKKIFDDTKGMDLPAFLSKGNTVFLTYEEREWAWKQMIAESKKRGKMRKI